MSQTKAQLLAPIGIITGPGLDITTASGTTFQLGSTGIITAVSANFSGNVTVGGTLTYEDVNNIDSVGLITARSGIDVTAGGIDITAGGAKITGVTTVTGTDDTDNFIVDVNNTHFAVHTDGTDGEVSLRAKDASGNNYSKYMTFFTNPSGSAATEKLRIGSAGQIGLSGANYGTSGQVMTSQGASAAPQWADASGGAWNLLSTTTVTSSAEIEVAIPQDGAYDDYAIRLVGLGKQDGTYFRMRIKIKIDGSLVTGNNYQHGHYGRYLATNGDASGSGSTSGTVDELGPDIWGWCGTFIISQPMGDYFDKSVYMPQIWGLANPGSATDNAFMGTGGVNVNNTKTNNLTSVIIYNAAGGGGAGTVTWDTGKVKLYGIS